MLALRDIKVQDDVNIIIALGMAKEGFDWIWYEHALTGGYHGSLTEIIQIIGRTFDELRCATPARVCGVAL